MAKIIIAPSKYIQGANEMQNIAKYASTFGQKPFIIADDFVMNLTRPTIESSFQHSGSDLHFDIFQGECSKAEIERLQKIYEAKNCDMVIGVGGGKTLDTAKAISYYANCPVAIVPTIASTDAPCSALSVIYHEDGSFSEYLILRQNPNMVLMDTAIIAKAPTRLIVAGMGDALATYFEARACHASNAIVLTGAYPSDTALTLAELCYETLLEDGFKAKLAVDQNVSTIAVENVVEANTYLSGVGFESGGIAAAHAIHNGFTVMDECHHLYHGEKVAFGTLAQLVLENAEEQELDEVIGFCLSVGLPICLADMGIEKIDHDKLMEVAKATCAEGETVHNMPFKVTPEDVYAAILTADALGRMVSE